MSMASVSVIAFLAIFFVLQPLTATSNFLSPLSPLLAPAFGLFLAELCLKICRMHDFFFLVLVVIILDSLMGLRVCHFINWVNLEFDIHSCLIMNDDDDRVLVVIFHFVGTENVCDKVTCGKGKCKASQNSTFFYECECDLGWKQNTMAADQNLKFLPCIAPDCELTLYLQL